MSKARPLGAEFHEFFDIKTCSPTQRQFLALRSFLYEGKDAESVAAEFGYKKSTVYTLARDFQQRFEECKKNGKDPFFVEYKHGRQKIERPKDIDDIIIGYRKKWHSVRDIKIKLDAIGYKDITEMYIYGVCEKSSFEKLPKRNNIDREEMVAKSIVEEKDIAPVSGEYSFFETETFSSGNVGILYFLPLIKEYGIDKAIEASSYTGTKQIPKLNSILAFLALKLSNVKRYSHDNAWCMDRGTGLFAGLNVLPKASWYNSYSCTVMREDNINFLKSLNKIFAEKGLFCGIANLDFTAIPYWGDEEPFENNWSGKRSKALISIQAVLAQDQDSGLINYGDTTVNHDNQDEVVLEFLDFRYMSGGSKDIKCLVFDSKFTTIENLGKINQRSIQFVTIQRKSKKLNEKVQGFSKDAWKSVRIERANNKSRSVEYCESKTTHPKYGIDPLRQIFIKGRSTKPVTILTNDLSSNPEAIIRRYSKRWLVETEISEQIHFFHLNHNCSGIVIKVDFDLTMSILAHNLYRLFAMRLPGYNHTTAQTIYNGFIRNYGDVNVGDDKITATLARKRSLPLIRETLPPSNETYSWLGNKSLVFEVDTHT